MSILSRRKLITTGIAATAGVAGLTVAARAARRYGIVPPDCRGVYGPGESLTYAARQLLAPHALAREFSRSMISQKPFANAIAPPSAAFKHLQAGGFADWRLAVDGMVAHPTQFSLADLKHFSARSQITEVVCEEGWSYVAEWIGTPLSEILEEVSPLPQARYVAYFSIESDWWDSLDMTEALHPQTLLTMGMNNGDLPVSFGGPLRLRVPRQLGYKSVKYVTRLTLTDSLKKIGNGQGAPGPDYGYTWFAGI